MSNETNEDTGSNEGENEDVPEPVFPERGPGKDEMVAGYLPAEDNWQAKTHIDETDPAAIAALREFGSIYPEVEEMQDLIDDFLDDFLETKTSVKGASREEYREILMSMYGSSTGDSESTAMKLVAADDD